MKKIFISALLCLNFSVATANPCDCNSPFYDPLQCAAENPTVGSCNGGTCEECQQALQAAKNSVPIDDHLWILALGGLAYAFWKSRK